MDDGKDNEGNTKIREQFVFAVVRGDMDLNETKLTNAIKARRVRPAVDGRNSPPSVP